MIPCGQVMPFIPRTLGYEVPLPIAAMLPMAHVRMAPCLPQYLQGSVAVFHPQLPSVLHSGRTTPKGVSGVYIRYPISCKRVCQWRPSTTAVFTIFWWCCVHTHFETYHIRYVSNFQCGQVIQASFQKTQVTEHPSKLMQCCPLGMSSGCRLYCRLNTEGLPYSIPNYHIFVIQEQPVQKGFAVFE